VVAPVRRIAFALAGARAVLSSALLVAAYYVLPLDSTIVGNGLGRLAIGLALVLAVTALLLGGITRSPHPVLRGVELLAVVLPMFLLVFASTYFVLAATGANFNVPLTRTDALYFAMTVFATVGFGDIVATSQVARIVVTVQMVGDLLVLGVLLRVVLTTVKHAVGRDRNPGD
jgi:hypothetical protein